MDDVHVGMTGRVSLVQVGDGVGTPHLSATTLGTRIIHDSHHLHSKALKASM